MLGIHLFGLRVPIGHHAGASPPAAGPLTWCFVGMERAVRRLMPAGPPRTGGHRRCSAGRPPDQKAPASPWPRLGHDGLRTVRQGGYARRSAARRDLATVRADAFRSLLRAVVARVRKPLLRGAGY